MIPAIFRLPWRVIEKPIKSRIRLGYADLSVSKRRHTSQRAGELLVKIPHRSLGEITTDVICITVTTDLPLT
jgi:hypothetical protein